MNYYNDIDPFCCEWLRHLIATGQIPKGVVDDRSIADVQPEDLQGFTQCHFFAGVGGWPLALRIAGWPADEPVWTGSCPCQPFSAAGKRRGAKDERHLWPEFFRLIRDCRPPALYGEQVASSEVVGSQQEAAFLVAVQDGDYARANKLAKRLAQSKSFHWWARWIDGVQADLASAGYAFGFTVLGAHSVGSPHIRQRVLWMADAERTEPGLREPVEQGRATEQRRNRPAIDGKVGGLADAQCDGGRIDEQERRPEGRVTDGRTGAGDNVGQWSSGRGAECSPEDLADKRGRRFNSALSHTLPATDGLDNTTDARHSQALESEQGQSSWRGRMPCNRSGACGLGNANIAIVHCRDNKDRRVSAQPGIFRMADGISASMGRLQSGLCGLDTGAERNSDRGQIDANAEEARPSENVQALRSGDEPQEIQRGIGGHGGVQETSLLRPPVHESCDGRHNQGAERQELPPAVSQAGEGCLRGVRSNGPTIARPPQGREWAEQQRQQFDYVVRALSSSLALAVLHGYGPEAKALSALREAITEKGAVRDALATVEEIWRSMSDEEKNAIRLRFGASACVIIPREPLSAGIPRDVGQLFSGLAGLVKDARRNRVGRVRGYGNAIVPQVAAEFIRSTLETL